MKKIFSEYKTLAITLIATGLISLTGYIGVLILKDTTIYKDLESNTVRTLYLEEEHSKDSVTIYDFKVFVNDYNEKKKTEFQVGLRFRELNKKLYFRDKFREYREIKSDYTGDYYRDENDNKVYINDKL